MVWQKKTILFDSDTQEQEEYCIWQSQMRQKGQGERGQISIISI